MAKQRSIVVTIGDHGDSEWVHASMTGPARVPDYGELCRLFAAVMPGWAYQVFAPPTNHINIHEHALHLWGRLDGENVLPDFGRFGTI